MWEIWDYSRITRVFPLQSFSAQLGQMRQKFGIFNSPLSIVLVTLHGGRESCGDALRTLRSRGVSVDEAHCLAGAPRGPILSVLRSHFLLCDVVSCLEEWWQHDGGWCHMTSLKKKKTSLCLWNELPDPQTELGPVQLIEPPPKIKPPDWTLLQRSVAIFCVDNHVLFSQTNLNFF